MANSEVTIKGEVVGEKDNRIILRANGKDYVSKIRLASTTIELYKAAGMASFVVDRNGFADKINRETSIGKQVSGIIKKN